MMVSAGLPGFYLWRGRVDQDGDLWWSLCSPFWGPTPHCGTFSTLAAVSFFLTIWDHDISAI